jgi:hypothetical protein
MLVKVKQNIKRECLLSAITFQYVLFDYYYKQNIKRGVPG